MQMMFFRSHAKLMITAEYTVLAGALALAMPVRFGQSMRVSQTDSHESIVEWNTKVLGSDYLRFRMRGPQLQVVDQEEIHSGVDDVSRAITRKDSARFIRSVLLAARECKPSFLSGDGLWKVFSELDFDLEWGLGSSSSLISNIAWWAGISPFDLHFKVSGGSAYDIACARSPQPILFRYKGKNRLPDFRPLCFDPPFSDKLFFVYSGNKQDSAKSIERFRPEKVSTAQSKEVSRITQVMSSTRSLGEFMECIRLHEELTAEVLQEERVQRARFPDFPGTIKSLGAWGGDFLLAAGDMPEGKLIHYFQERGYRELIPFNRMKIQV